MCRSVGRSLKGVLGSAVLILSNRTILQASPYLHSTVSTPLDSVDALSLIDFLSIRSLAISIESRPRLGNSILPRANLSAASSSESLCVLKYAVSGSKLLSVRWMRKGRSDGGDAVSEDMSPLPPSSERRERDCGSGELGGAPGIARRLGLRAGVL